MGNQRSSLQVVTTDVYDARRDAHTRNAATCQKCEEQKKYRKRNKMTRRLCHTIASLHGALQKRLDSMSSDPGTPFVGVVRLVLSPAPLHAAELADASRLWIEGVRETLENRGGWHVGVYETSLTFDPSLNGGMDALDDAVRWTGTWRVADSGWFQIPTVHFLMVAIWRRRPAAAPNGSVLLPLHAQVCLYQTA